LIQPLKRSLSVNHPCCAGIVNGTTNTFLRQCKPKAGTNVLAVAQQLGYAEADPSADVDGLDAADKIAITSPLAGGRIKLQDVYCENSGLVGQILPMPRNWVL